MNLYRTPKGQWAGTEAHWKAAMKAEGSDPKGRSSKDFMIDFPTAKGPLLDFLNFHVLNLEHPTPLAPLAQEVAQLVEVAAAAPGPFDLDDAFSKAPVGQQLRLAVTAIDEAMRLVTR